MTDTRYIPLASLLIDIECELRRANLWSAEPPSAEALASIEPFCVDTMDFQQWLQFVLLPRMNTLITAQAPLPDKCDITTMAETVWAANVHAKHVIDALRAFDQTINDTP
ncbi:MAG TPA: YqcC family protein [Pseudomonadales bacterium]|nr:YqcC family protein [Pseudomonadales bacterium]